MISCTKQHSKGKPGHEECPDLRLQGVEHGGLYYSHPRFLPYSGQHAGRLTMGRRVSLGEDMAGRCWSGARSVACFVGGMWSGAAVAPDGDKKIKKNIKVINRTKGRTPPCSRGMQTTTVWKTYVYIFTSARCTVPVIGGKKLARVDLLILLAAGGKCRPRRDTHSCQHHRTRGCNQ